MNHLQNQIRNDGFCVIDGVIPPKEVDAVRQSVQKTIARLIEQGVSMPEGIDFVPSIINHDQSFAPYLAEERLLNLARSVLGQHVRISFTSAILNRPGKQRDRWHADWPFNQRVAGRI